MGTRTRSIAKAEARQRLRRQTMGPTPGPWRVGKGGPNGCPTVGTDKGLLVCMMGHSVNLAHQAHTARANARLIAEAPRMLEALKKALPHVESAWREAGDDFDHGASEAREAIHNVIAKIEGKETSHDQ